MTLSFSRIAAWFAFASLPLFADQIVLKSGDRVTGAIIKRDAKQITIKSDGFGVITTDLDKVASIVADKPINVVTADGKTIVGTLREAEGKAEIVAGAAPVTVPTPTIQALRNEDEQRAFLRLQNPRWLDLWAGSANFGFAGAAGNARTSTFTTGFNATRETRSDKTTVSFNAVRASALANGRFAGTAQAVRGSVGYARNIHPRVFVNGFNDYEYDKFQNLDFRTVLGGGLGYKAIKRDRTRLDLLGGGAYNYSRFNTPLTRKNAEAYWGDDFQLKLFSGTSLFQTFRMFNNLSERGEYRVNFDIGATTKIAKWLTWNVVFSDRYLSNPAPGRKTNDLLYSTGLGITFAR
jgi:putative salt-induced outer membrane protein YdiY